MDLDKILHGCLHQSLSSLCKFRPYQSNITANLNKFEIELYQLFKDRFDSLHWSYFYKTNEINVTNRTIGTIESN